MVRSGGWCLLLSFVGLLVVPFMDRVGGAEYDDDDDLGVAEPPKLIVVDVVEHLNASHVPVPIGDTNPLGISFEFFAFPAYATRLSQTAQCLKNLEQAYGMPSPIRIGGTTQDRARYDREESQPVRYQLPSGGGAAQVPARLSFGPEFIRLANQLSPGPLTFGLNRQSGNLLNAGIAARDLVDHLSNLYAIELGNEPEFWAPGSPERKGLKNWTPDADARSQKAWQREISTRVAKKALVQAGVFLSPPRWSVSELALQEGPDLQYVKSFGGHAYPQSACGNSKTSLAGLMNHTQIVSFVSRFEGEVRAAKKLGKPYHFSETNSATCGGHGISGTFGAALWLIDYVFQALLLGVNRLYFHQGTINHSPYSFWNATQVSPTYYGAYFVSLALRGATELSRLPSSRPEVAVYGLWKCGRLVRLVIYHSEFRGPDSPARSPEPVEIHGLPPDVLRVRLLRLAAQHAFVSATGRLGPDHVSFGNTFFDNRDCTFRGPPLYQTLPVPSGPLQLHIAPSQAIIIELVSKIPAPFC
ncbi:hypothetical protein PGT21_030738 [Puccinia graminis f. sp. tritici]|uniref:Beta-glucuronidase C-terminal domain-containing protein n=2 Tax=Puccinia graminis f. sp. tritici TaxID=56615 RepID=A0A5B0QKA5_PUCGR|nr:hypothetical protein PGT21_030738 [Puccinia graminis f. sp. tritici]